MSRIVVIKLALHGPAGRPEEPTDRVSNRGSAAVTHVQGPRGIGRYELDLNLFIGVAWLPAIIRAGVEYAGYALGVACLRQGEVDKARTGDLGFGNDFIGG